MRYFELCTPHYDAPRVWTGTYQADARWMLPGVECPTCGETWSGIALAYPSVDLSRHPLRTELETPRLEPFARYARLLEQVKPLLPPGAQVEPGTTFGPLVGTAEGTFGPLVLRDPWKLLVREDALDALRAAGLQGLVPVRAELTSSGASIPALHELELTARGRLLPLGPPPCETCGRMDAAMPEECRLEDASLPKDLDVFRLTDAVTLIVATERFVEVVRGLGSMDVLFRELPVGGGG
ncbi:SitI6 family double-CXXCG motif immunity protein [Corallococcus sp. M7]